MPIELVKQSNDYNCGMACLAMVTGKTIKYLERAMGRTCMEPGIDGAPKLPIFATEMEVCLFLHKINNLRFIDVKYYNETYARLIQEEKILACDRRFLFSHLYDGGTAILGVPSLNMPSFGHWIVYANGKVYDPSHKKTYTVETLNLDEVHEAVLCM